MITCNQAVRQMWDYLEGDIDAHDKAAIEEHLSVCRRCCGEAEFATELRHFLESHSADQIPSDARARLSAFLDRL